MDKKISKKRKITAEKCIGRPDNFEITPPKIKSNILEKLIKEYSKNFETWE